MRIVIRTDSSSTIGTGHVMRCLALADELRRLGLQVEFICRTLPGDLNQWIEKNDFRVYIIDMTTLFDWESDAIATKAIIDSMTDAVDWLIVDHYQLDLSWENEIKNHVKHIMVIDDYVNRTHECEVYLNQNWYSDMENACQSYLPAQCHKLLGPQYALLRQEFSRLHKLGCRQRKEIKNILVFFGGADLDNQTEKALMAVLALQEKGLNIDVVVGAAYKYYTSLSKRVEEFPNVVIHRQISNIADLMFKADLALGAAGISVWERCCLGLPSIVVEVADNQHQSAEYLAQQGVLVFLGKHLNVSVDDWKKAIQARLNDCHGNYEISVSGFSLVDALGCERVAHQLLQ